MNPFVKKEVRLLLPGWLAVLALAVVSPWLFLEDWDTALNSTPLFVFFGTILLGVDVFGREFSLGTFSSLMSQPIQRGQIWRTKITLLLSAAALILLAYFISCELLVQRAPQLTNQVTSLAMLHKDFLHATLGGAAAILIALAGGLWTTLLLRQISAAFWITFLTPLAFLILIIFFVPSKWTDSEAFPLVLYGLAGIYGVAGFWLAHRLFHRSQDAAWTGGVIAFSRWRYFEARSGKSISMRRRRPMIALFKKEFQLHSISLFCVGGLLVLQMGMFCLRGFYSQFHRNSAADLFSEFFWTFWLVVPLVIGCMAVAEERKLGVMESQFCLPVSRRTQFLIKFFPAAIAGIVLGGVVPLILEMTAAWLGAPNEFFKTDSGAYTTTDIVSLFGLMLPLSAGLVLAGFFASSLARNFLQALSIGIVMLAGFFFFIMLLDQGRNPRAGEITHAGSQLWGAVLPAVIGGLTIIFYIPWLSYRNFSHFAETARLWRRTIISLIGAAIFVFATSALIYNRAWEVFKPVEPAHGPAKLSLSDPPNLQIHYSGIQVRFPDGRLWFDYLENYRVENPSSAWRQLWNEFLRPLPKSFGPEQYLAGSNWVSAVPGLRVSGGQPEQVGYLDTVAIQADGTLWTSRGSAPSGTVENKMVQFDAATDWQQVVRVGVNFALLKTDGTLWQWGTNGFNWPDWQTHWPTVLDSPPRRLRTDSDWKKLYSDAFLPSFAQKADGTVWLLSPENKTGNFQVTKQTNWLDKVASDHVNTADHFSWLGSDWSAYVSTNGTLWVCNRRREQSANGWSNSWKGAGFLQVDNETDWADVAVMWNQLVALKTDGSLWQWKKPENDTCELAKIPPTHLGIHNDWIAVSSLWDGSVALAADGSLWFWPEPGAYDGSLMKAQKQPKFLANIFSANH
jgi:ABC-type transport system involved in multi-copper enzyme maturation permease subunit